MSNPLLNLRIFYPAQNSKKPHPGDLENTAIPQFKIKITEILQEKLSNTAIGPQTPMSPSLKEKCECSQQESSLWPPD